MRDAANTRDIIISIHALTRSATAMNDPQTRGEFISIHALTRSATSAAIRVGDADQHFNPRTHEECDRATCQGI